MLAAGLPRFTPRQTNDNRFTPRYFKKSPAAQAITKEVIRMRNTAIALAVVLLVLAVLAVATHAVWTLYALVLIAAGLVGVLWTDRTASSPEGAAGAAAAKEPAASGAPAVAAAPAPPPAPAVPPAPPVSAANQFDAEVVNFLSILQERGRFIDFLMGDINNYNDAQVGAAARVMHEGCKAALRENFGISPTREEKEGSTITIPTGYAPDDYRLVGKISGEAPFTGTLIHHGWKADWVKLPRVARVGADKLPTIAPAEVELR